MSEDTEDIIYNNHFKYLVKQLDLARHNKLSHEKQLEFVNFLERHKNSELVKEACEFFDWYVKNECPLTITRIE